MDPFLRPVSRDASDGPSGTIPRMAPANKWSGRLDLNQRPPHPRVMRYQAALRPDLVTHVLARESPGASRATRIAGKAACGVIGGPPLPAHGAIPGASSMKRIYGGHDRLHPFRRSGCALARRQLLGPDYSAGHGLRHFLVPDDPPAAKRRMKDRACADLRGEEGRRGRHRRRPLGKVTKVTDHRKSRLSWAGGPGDCGQVDPDRA